MPIVNQLMMKQMDGLIIRKPFAASVPGFWESNLPDGLPCQGSFLLILQGRKSEPGGWDGAHCRTWSYYAQGLGSIPGCKPKPNKISKKVQ